MQRNMKVVSRDMMAEHMVLAIFEERNIANSLTAKERLCLALFIIINQVHLCALMLQCQNSCSTAAREYRQNGYPQQP